MSAAEASISDGHVSVSYAEIRDAAPAWDAWLDENDVSRLDCLALAAGTGARSAAALLALLKRGQSVLLWRQPIMVKEDAVVPDSMPAFCRAVLMESDTHRANEAAAGPDGFRLRWCRPEAATATRIEKPYAYLPTSGTTGEPKIVAYETETLLGNARNCIARLQLSSADRVLIPVPLAHMYGLGAAFLPAVSVEACVRLLPEANLLNYVQAEQDFAPTAAFLTPAFCHLLVKGRKQSRAYRLTVLAGDAADEQTFAAYEQRYGCTVNLYGSTELGVISAGSPDDPYAVRRDFAGMPLSGVQLAAPGEGESGQPFPLRFDHPYGCSGYAGGDGNPLKPPELYRDGWYWTQDLGRVDEAGRLQLAGRFDDTVKRDGFLVAFAEVERALQRLEAIDRVVVVPGAMTPRGRELVAFCTAASGTIAGSSMRRLALELLPGHAVPDRFIFVETLPLTATAKPDRMALAAMAQKPL